MQGSNLITLAAISTGILFAVLGCKRGFYVIWTIMFNMVISIYIGVMFTPSIAAFMPSLFGKLKPGEPAYWYAYAAIVAAVAIICMFVLQIIAMTHFTGTFKVSLPRLFDNLGAAFVGFVAGYILWGFVCFLILIMPVSNNVLFKSFTSTSQSRELCMPAVSNTIDVINALSLQPNRPQVRNVISWTLGWEIKEPNDVKPHLTNGN
jgi:MFS family permease